MNDKLKNWLNNLTDDDYQKMADDLKIQIEADRTQLKAFFKSPRYQAVISQLINLVGDSGAISDNPYQEPLFGDVSNEEYIKLFSIAFDSEISQLSIMEDTSHFFPCQFVIMNNLKFLEINGQGTSFVVQGLKFNPLT